MSRMSKSEQGKKPFAINTSRAKICTNHVCCLRKVCKGRAFYPAVAGRECCRVAAMEMPLHHDRGHETAAKEGFLFHCYHVYGDSFHDTESHALHVSTQFASVQANPHQTVGRCHMLFELAWRSASSRRRKSHFTRCRLARCSVGSVWKDEICSCCTQIHQITIGTYSMIFGWPYAVGMVGLIAIHEAGHAWVMHQRGIPFSPAVFIPFMGAVIATKQQPRDAWEDAVIGYGGPALGSLGAGAVAVGAHMTDSQLLYAVRLEN